jgi:hypothetical protein
MHIAIKNCSMHIAIKKTETSSPNEQTWSNTFQGTLGPHFIVNRMISTHSPESSQTFGQSHHQHIGEEVWGVTMVVHVLTWTLSSWFGQPLNA